ncbi:MAG: aldo/keto reductase [Clostridia bacterium]|nr:aldo/keto reductase [Clostridia bacterium]
MQSMNIGASGISVPFLGLGTWAIGGGSWWGDNDDSVSVRAIHKAIDCGIAWIDTAPIYGLYHSEKVVGEALRGKRDKVILSTKCGLQWRHETPILHKTVDGTTVYRDLSKASIIQDVEESLTRLGTDHIDVLYTHWQTTDFVLYPLEETLDAFLTLRRQGKIRAIGASNVTPEIVKGYVSLGGLDVIQEKYSILTRRIERELLPLCQSLGVSVQAYSPLEQGLLTGKVTMESRYPDGDTRRSNPNFAPDRREKALRLLALWQDLTEKYNCSIGNLVLAYTAKHQCVHVLAGARTPQQAEDNARSLTLSLDEKDMARMCADIAQLFPDDA